MKAKKFKATLELERGGLGWTIVQVPFVPSKVWPDMVRLRVRGTISNGPGDGFAFRNSLFPMAGQPGVFFLLVNKAMQKGGRVALGSVADFVLEPDLDDRPAELPDDLAMLLDDEPGLRGFYDELSESNRREIGKWCALAKSDEAKRHRAEQVAERLLGAMEGERELPPFVEAAFRARPKARAGWAKMTLLQRRQELMAVYYYQSPEAREKRVRKLVEAAEKRAG